MKNFSQPCHALSATKQEIFELDTRLQCLVFISSGQMNSSSENKCHYYFTSNYDVLINGCGYFSFVSSQELIRLCHVFLWRVCKISKSDLASSRLSCHPSAWNNSATTEPIFMKFDEDLSQKLSRKIHHKNHGYFTWRPVYIFHHISLSSS
jgi:hypothetical protein